MAVNGLALVMKMTGLPWLARFTLTLDTDRRSRYATGLRHLHMRA